jgi:uncharacterized short protein YbdD (DUF466 family)
MKTMVHAARTIWDYLREILGEKAYDRYCAFSRARGEEPMSEREFFLRQQKEKYSKPCRCC